MKPKTAISVLILTLLLCASCKQGPKTLEESIPPDIDLPDAFYLGVLDPFPAYRLIVVHLDGSITVRGKTVKLEELPKHCSDGLPILVAAHKKCPLPAVKVVLTQLAEAGVETVAFVTNDLANKGLGLLGVGLLTSSNGERYGNNAVAVTVKGKAFIREGKKLTRQGLSEILIIRMAYDSNVSLVLDPESGTTADLVIPMWTAKHAGLTRINIWCGPGKPVEIVPPE